MTAGRAQASPRCVAALAAGLVSFGWLVCAALPAAAADLDGTLLVVNRPAGVGSVSMIDMPTGAEVARLPIGPAVPHEIAVSPDGRFAVTGEYGSGDAPGRRVVVIDVVDARIAGYIDLGPMSRPHSFAFLPDGRRAVATMENSDRIALVDLPTLAVVKTFPTGGREGHMVRVSPDGAWAWVASRGAEGTVSAISLREDVPPVVIAAGAGAEGLAISPDGTEVWVLNRRAATVTIVNTVSRSVSATLATAGGGGRAAISAGGRVLVTGGDAALSVYDQGSRRLIASLPVPADGTAGAAGIDVFGEIAFVADRVAGSLAVYKLPDLSRITLLAEGRPTPDGVGYSPLRVAAMAGATGTTN